MAGIKGICGQGVQEMDGFRKLCIFIKQMESANDTCNALFPADSACILCDAADAAVGAAGDKEKTFVCPAHQGRVVRAEVLLFFAVYSVCADCLSLFKAIKLWDLPQEKTIFRERNRRLGRLVTEQSGDLFRGIGGAYVFILIVFRLETQRMCHKPGVWKVILFTEVF